MPGPNKAPVRSNIFEIDHVKNNNSNFNNNQIPEVEQKKKGRKKAEPEVDIQDLENQI